ncbi:MAG: hypothetical protein WAM53_01615 [Terrimicrobiaceae bacterium]
MKLVTQNEAEAARYGIEVEFNGRGVVLDAPEGWQFDDELHSLVSSQWDNEPMPNVYRAALRDIAHYGPRLKRCPDDCPCKE